MGHYLVADFPTPQAALDAAAADPGSLVTFEPISYPLPAPLVVGSDTTVRAYGAHLRGVNGNHRLVRSFRDADSFAGYEGPSRISVFGGVWDCRGQDAPPGTVANAMNFCHGSRITVADATIRNVAGAHAVEVAAIDGAIIRHCRFEGFLDTGGRDFSEAVQVDLTKSPMSTDIGLWDNTPCRDVTVLDCHMGPSADLGPFGALAGNHSQVAAGTYHDRIRVLGCDVNGSLLHAIRPYAWRGAVIQGNTVVGTTGTSILVQYSTGVTVSGNTVRGSGRNGVNVSASTQVVVQGNTIADTADEYCVWVGRDDDTTSTDVLVTGNVLHGGHDAAVRLASGTHRCTVSGNLIRRGGGGDTGVSCTAGAGTTNKVIHNDIAGFGTPIAISGGTVLDH
jgi:parallel beta-helix repeat protein